MITKRILGQKRHSPLEVLCNFQMCECEVSDANCSFDNECRELGIAIVPYSPLGKGFFAGSKLTGAEEGDIRAVCNLSLAYSLGSYSYILLLLIRALVFGTLQYITFG